VKKIFRLFKFRLFRIVFVVLIITGGILFYQHRQDTEDPTCKDCNLILISVDTLRPDHMGVYGYEKNTTPNIDRWAKNATVFTNAYTIFPLTFQSFYTLFTGRDDVLKNDNFSYSYSVNMVNNPRSTTLPSIMAKQGYKTAAFVTNPVIDVLGFKVFKVGFQSFKYFDDTNLTKNMKRNNLDGVLYSIFSKEYENSVSMTKNVVSWLNHNNNEKFFLWVHFTNPHEPYNPPIRFSCELKDTICDPNIYANNLLKGPPRCNQQLPVKLTDDDLSLMQEYYDAEILGLDSEIGKIMTTIKEQGLSKKTVVIFYSDHGEGFDHNILTHGYSLYDSNVHIPLIIASPGINKTIYEGLVDNTEILPTVLDLLKIEINANDFTGNSFQKGLTSGITVSNKEVFFKTPQDWTNKFGVTNSKYKYIYSNKNICLNEEGIEEYYDMQKDPRETNNLFYENNEYKLKEDLKNYFSDNIKKINEDEKNLENNRSLGY